MKQTLAQVIEDKDKPYKPACTNCKDKGEVKVNVRANTFNIVPCPVCNVTYLAKGE